MVQCCKSKNKVFAQQETRKEIEQRLNISLKMEDHEVLQLVTNFRMFDDNDDDNMPMANFQQMIGFIGDSFLGERIFFVTKQSYKTSQPKEKNTSKHSKEDSIDISIKDVDEAIHLTDHD